MFEDNNKQFDYNRGILTNPLHTNIIDKKSLNFERIKKTEQSNKSMSKDNSSFLSINKNLDRNEIYIPVITSRENFNIQLKIEEEANKTLHNIKNNKIDQNKLERDIKLS